MKVEARDWVEGVSTWSPLSFSRFGGDPERESE